MQQTKCQHVATLKFRRSPNASNIVAHCADQKDQTEMSPPSSTEGLWPALGPRRLGKQTRNDMEPCSNGRAGRSSVTSDHQRVRHANHGPGYYTILNKNQSSKARKRSQRKTNQSCLYISILNLQAKGGREGAAHRNLSHAPSNL